MSVNNQAKLLLTSVFGPYGVDDSFGRKENIMEVMHNQVTREQGLFSIRFNQETYAFHLMAENLDMPTVILDFPSLKRFIKEIKKGYDYIGISFIAPNFIKAQHMAHLIRRYAPETKIILGGHGTAIENIEAQISHDYICRGDGVKCMRDIFGLDVSAPVKHPLREFCFNRYIMGVPVSSKMLSHGIILPGVGCVNGCRFCSTSHFFQKEYVSFLETGQEVFDLCRRYEEEMGITDFYIQDENFFQKEKRARDLLALMEEHNKPYTFNTFTTAESVERLGVDFLQRIGVEFLWMGLESMIEIYPKNQGIDYPLMIRRLREQGVNILLSGILFIEEHTKENIYQDIDYMIGLKPDFVQFMQLSPLPVTKLYENYKEQEKLIPGIPYEEWHGQHKIWYRHPHFSPEDSAQYIKDAFKKDFDVNGPSLLRTAETALMGAIQTENATDTFMKLRHRKRKERAFGYYPMLDALVAHAHNPEVKAYAEDVRKRYYEFFKGKPVKIKALSAITRMLTVKEKIRGRLVYNNMRQPPTRYTTYRLNGN